MGFADLGLVVVDENFFSGPSERAFQAPILGQRSLNERDSDSRTLCMSLSGLQDLSIISHTAWGPHLTEIYVGQINDRLIEPRSSERPIPDDPFTTGDRAAGRYSLDLLPEVKIDVATGK